MTPTLQAKRDALLDHRHHSLRRRVEFEPAERFEQERLSHARRVTEALCRMLEAETPYIAPGESIFFWRTVENLPPILTDAEWARLRESGFLHEQGRVCNLSPDYGRVIRRGLGAERAEAERLLAGAQDNEQAEFYCCAIASIDAVLDLCARYQKAAEDCGSPHAGVLSRVPREGARTFHEALQSLRILQYTLWCEGEYHNTLGRFDQYMWPYLERDLRDGRLTESAALELLEEFFLSLNRDSDLYPGIQQGDNGQSLMLGGVTPAGEPAFNLLSSLCLQASKELKLIDPKINLRVDHTTPLEIFEAGTQLTREGLGFPQYSNDDVVIPGLVELGYSLEDARDYTVAACWEFIIPGVGMDIPNIAAVNFPALVNDCAKRHLESCADFSQFQRAFSDELCALCRDTLKSTRPLRMIPAPFLSVLMDGCMERGRDISFGGRYNNYGFHGVGLATAIDSLDAIRRCVYEEKTHTARQMVDVIDGCAPGELLRQLRYDLPKFGTDEDGVNETAVWLLRCWGDAVAPLRNERGGRVRAGTGSAMFYLWHADKIGDTPGGHRAGEAFGANYAPQLFVRDCGPLSVIRSFTAPDLKRVINGGPLTMEFHAGIFRDEDSLRKVALLVKAFVDEGGHQMQLNTVDLEVLKDAQRRPEAHKNLIVRVWGWSAYFVELDEEFQNHVMARQAYRP